MSKTIKFKVEKLVRDKTAQRLEAKGIRSTCRVLTDDQLSTCLKDKLLEEAREVVDAKDVREVANELADLFEVAYSLAQSYGIALEDVEKLRLEKLSERGSFDQRIYMEHVEAEADNPATDYYCENSDKYPEIE